MQKRTLLIPVISVFTYLALSSSTSGPAHNSLANQTGSPGSIGTCVASGCHVAGTGTNGSIELRKKSWGATSTTVSYYETGETYLVTIKGTNTSSSLTHFGFQFTAEEGGGNTPVGTYGNFGAGVYGFPTASPTLVEHSAPIAKNGSGEYEATFEWTAPSSGVGKVTLYAMLNACNNDNTVNGDVPSNTISLELNDRTSVGEISGEVVFKAYPNPVRNILTLDMDKAEEGTYDITVYGYNGTLVSHSELYISPAKYTGAINTSNWTPGMYFIHMQKEGQNRIMPIIKQ